MQFIWLNICLSFITIVWTHTFLVSLSIYRSFLQYWITRSFVSDVQKLMSSLCRIWDKSFRTVQYHTDYLFITLKFTKFLRKLFRHFHQIYTPFLYMGLFLSRTYVFFSYYFLCKSFFLFTLVTYLMESLVVCKRYFLAQNGRYTRDYFDELRSDIVFLPVTGSVVYLFTPTDLKLFWRTYILSTTRSKPDVW